MPVGPFQTVVGATVPLTVQLSGPPPAAGARFKVTCSPADLCTVVGTTDNVVEITRAAHDEKARQDGSSAHVLQLTFPKKTLPTKPLSAPALPLGAPPWNTVRLVAQKTTDGAPDGATVTTAEAEFQVTVAGVSLSFPVGDDWWIKPAAWSAQATGNQAPEQDWTPAMKDALINGLPLAAGDQVEVRVQRNGAYPWATQTGKGDLPAGKLAKVTSWAFGADLIPGQSGTVVSETTHRPRSFVVEWADGETLSLPVAITLDPPPNVLDLVRTKDPQQTPLAPLLGPQQQPTAQNEKMPPIPVTITPLARGAVGTPSQGVTITTTGTTTTTVNEWGPAAPGHERGLRAQKAREVGFDASFAAQTHRYPVMQRLRLPIVSSAVATAPLRGVVHGLLLEENGGYQVPWTIEPGALSTTCEVVLRHPSKVSPDVPPEEDPSPQPSTPPPPPPPDEDDVELERLHLEVTPDPACQALVIDPEERGARRQGVVGKRKGKRVLKALAAPELELEVFLPRASFDRVPLVDPPPPTKRSAWLVRWAEKKTKKLLGKKWKQLVVQGVWGLGDTAQVRVALDTPAPEGGATVRLVSPAFGATPEEQQLDVVFPEGETVREREVTFRAASEKPQRLQVLGLPRTGHTDGGKSLWIIVADAPAAFFPTQESDWALSEQEDALGLVSLFEEEDETGPRERPPWIEPAGPFARGDELTVRVRLTQPAGEGGAKADLVCAAFDQRYAVDFAEGTRDAEVTVRLAKKVDSSLQVLRLEGVSGCVAGFRGRHELQVLPERAAYFPPRACLAPSGPFVQGDHCTLSVMVHPPAPRGGCELLLRGPFADERVELAEGEVFKAVTVQLTREADQPQLVSLVPQRACERGRFAEFELTVKTPEVAFAPGVLWPERAARVGEPTTVVLSLSHPAPAKRPLTPPELEKLRLEAQQLVVDDTLEAEVELLKQSLPPEEAFGGAITLRCDAFDPPEVRARVVPGATQVSVPVKVKADEALAGERTLELVDTPAPYRCKPGPRPTATIRIDRSPWVSFAEPAFRPGPGVATSGRDEDVVFRAGQTATLRLTCQRHPVGADLRVELRSPAFGGTVPIAMIPGLPGKKREGGVPAPSDREEDVPPVEVTVTLARGLPDAGGGKPKDKLPIELRLPRGWRAANDEEGVGRLELWVLAPTPSETCPLKRDEGAPPGDELVLDTDARPCNIDKLLVAEFHGELPEDPDPTAPPDPNAPPPPQPKVGTRETELTVIKGTTNLVDGKRGPWEVVRDLSLASDPATALVYRPGEPPVIQVIAGKVPNPLRSQAEPADPKFHRTHISVQMPRGRFCTHLFEEQRKVPLLPTGPGPQGPLQQVLDGQQPTAPTFEALVRHHPIVDVQRPQSKGKGSKRKLLTHVYPPIPDVRERAAADDDPVSPRMEPVHQGTAPQVQQARPGEDATTQKGYATLCTFTVEPKKLPIDKLTRVTLPTLPQSPLHGALGPIATELRALGLDGPSDVLMGVSDGTQQTVDGLNTGIEGLNKVLPFLGRSTGSNEVMSSQDMGELSSGWGIFDPATGTILGIQPMTVVKLVWFFFMKPRRYLITVRSCGVPDPQAETPAPPCDELQVQVDVYPSDEMNFTWKFKPIPETVKVGVDGKYVCNEDRYEERSFGTGQDQTWEEHQEERAQQVQDSEDRYTQLEEDKALEREQEVQNEVRVTDYSTSDQAMIDQAAKDSYQAQALDRDVEYRAEITIPPRNELEGRWGQPGKLEKTGSEQEDLREDGEVGDLLRFRYREVLAKGEPRRPEEGGWHGGVPVGAAPGWKPPKEPGQQHQVKSKVFSPVGYGPTMLGPIPPEELPPQYRNELDVCQQVAQSRFQDHLVWQGQNVENARDDVQSDVTIAQDGAQQTGERVGAYDPMGALGSAEGTVLALKQNGGTNAALQKINDAFVAVSETITNILSIFNKLGGDWVPTFGWGLRFEVGFLEGALTFYWGFKEAYNADFADPGERPLARQTFRWFALHMDLVLLSLRFQLDAGFRLVAAFLHFEAVIYLKIHLDASIKGGFERTRPDKKLPSWVDTWLITPAKAELGLKVVIVNEHLLAAHACLRTGFDFKWRFALPDLDDVKGDKGLPERKKRDASRFGIEYEIHFVGLTAHLTVTLLGFGTRPKVWKIVEGNPPELPIKRGMFPGAANKTFTNLRQMLKLAWNKALYQRRRIVNRYDRWQELQLEMVARTTQKNEDGAPKWPKTKVPPGHVYAGDGDDEEKRRWWEENRAAWEEQWEACKLAFGREAFKVRKRVGQGMVSVQKVVLAERLTSLTGKVEDIFRRKLLPRLDEVEERMVLLKQLDAQADEEEATADERGKPSDTLLKAVKKLLDDPVLNWRQNRFTSGLPLDQLDRAFLSLAYYHPQREAW